MELGLYAVLAPLIQEHGAPDRLLPTATDSAFHALAHVIMGQQLSVIAARNIAQKVKDACGVSSSNCILPSFLTSHALPISAWTGSGALHSACAQASAAAASCFALPCKRVWNTIPTASHKPWGPACPVLMSAHDMQSNDTCCCMQGHEQLQAAAVLELPGPELLACGLSRQKLAYITDLAHRFHTGTLETRSIVGAS